MDNEGGGWTMKGGMDNEEKRVVKRRKKMEMEEKRTRIQL